MAATPYFLDLSEAQKPPQYAQLRAGMRDALDKYQVGVHGSSNAMVECLWVRVEGEIWGVENRQPLAGREHGTCEGYASVVLDMERCQRLRNALMLLVEGMDVSSSPLLPSVDPDDAIIGVAPPGYRERIEVYPATEVYDALRLRVESSCAMLDEEPQTHGDYTFARGYVSVELDRPSALLLARKMDAYIAEMQPADASSGVPAVQVQYS
jgi:hypothetical protein